MTAARSQQWAEPAAEPVAAGVVRIPLPMPGDRLTAVNVYAIEDGAGVALIDGGWAIAPARAQLETALRSIGVNDLRHITQILVTHVHRDHYTLAVALRREFAIPIRLGAGERASLLTQLQGEGRYAAQLRLLRRAGAFELAEQIQTLDTRIEANPTDAANWELPDTWLTPGEVTVGSRQLSVVPTPGHTRGHVVFADVAAGLLFSGDHVLPDITPSIGFEPAPAESPLDDYLDSLAVVQTLPDLRLLPAHGPVKSSTHARVQELIDHHDTRLQATLAVLAARPDGAGSGWEVAAGLTWTRHRRHFDQLDRFNQMLAVTETLAHLDLLARAGRLTAQPRSDTVVSYRAPDPADRSGSQPEERR